MNNKSLFDYIKDNIVDGKLKDDFSLPKEENDFIYADGARDGIQYYHMGPQEMNDNEYQLMLEAIKYASEGEFEIAEKLFIELSKTINALSIIDKLQNYIWEIKDNLKAGNIYEFGLYLALESDKKECVKFGLSILELMNTNNDETKRDIKILALSDEFTFYCINIMKTWVNGNEDIFECAKNVYGWGRIHAVKELRVLKPLTEEIRKWMLEEGINNNIMPSYSALTIWRNGNIGSILYVNPNEEELKYIGRILDAMLDEDAVPGLSTLDKRREIILVYLNEINKYILGIEEYEIIYHIMNYFKEEDDKEIIDLCNKLLFSNNAKNIIMNAIKEGRALDLAINIGIDVKYDVLKLIKNDFKKYNHLCRYIINDRAYRKELLKIYNDNLPLEDMKCEPSLDYCLTEEYWRESSLDFLLQELRRYPCEGREFVEASLQLEPTRTRNGALMVLKRWVELKKTPLKNMLPDIHALLMSLYEKEPSETTKDMMFKLIRGDIKFEEEIFKVEKKINQETLNILSDAISDIGSWCWWHIDKERVQLEFRDVQLYDYSKEEKEANSSVIALVFKKNAYALFLDNKDNDNKKKWYDQLHDDEISPFDINGYEFEFNNSEFVNEVINEYKNKTEMKKIKDDLIINSKYILAAKCYDVGFVVGGDELEIINHQGKLNEDDIKKASNKWWEYWQDYHKKRKTKDAYEEDYACEVTIPVSKS